MHSETEKKKLELILKGLYENRLISHRYFTQLDGSQQRRLGEPHLVMDVPGGTLIRIYQREPVEGWRFFRLAMMDEVRLEEGLFQPRISKAIHTASAERILSPVSVHNEAQEEYRNRLQAVIADLTVSGTEANALAEFRKAYGLSPEEVRGVHYQAFADCLIACIQDRVISAEETALLRELDRCLKVCGCGVLD